MNAVTDQPDDVVDSASVLWSLLCKAFGADRKQQPKYQKIHKELEASLSNTFLHEPLVDARTKSIQSQTPNLVSFSSSIIDQNLWERPSHTSTVDDGVVETDFFSLIQNFVGHGALPALLGTDFTDVYPGILEDLQDLDNGMKYLMLGIPRWFPFPTLARVSVARRRLDNAIDSFHRALDKIAADEEPDEPWKDLSDISDSMRDRSAVYRRYNVPPALKGPLDLHLIWS